MVVETLRRVGRVILRNEDTTRFGKMTPAARVASEAAIRISGDEVSSISRIDASTALRFHLSLRELASRFGLREMRTRKPRDLFLAVRAYLRDHPGELLYIDGTCAAADLEEFLRPLSGNLQMFVEHRGTSAHWESMTTFRVAAPDASSLRRCISDTIGPAKPAARSAWVFDALARDEIAAAMFAVWIRQGLSVEEVLRLADRELGGNTGCSGLELAVRLAMAQLPEQARRPAHMIAWVGRTAEVGPDWIDESAAPAWMSAGLAWRDPLSGRCLLPARIAEMISQLLGVDAEQSAAGELRKLTAVDSNRSDNSSLLVRDALAEGLLRQVKPSAEATAFLRGTIDRLRECGCLTRAAELQRRHIERLKRGNVPSVDDELHRLGAILLADQQLGGATAAMTEARKRREERHRLDLDQDLDLAEACLHESLVARALYLLREVERAIRSGECGNDAARTLRFRFLQGACLLATKRPEEAVKVLEATLPIRAALLGESHPDLMQHRVLLARAWFAVGDGEAAERILRDDLRIRESSPQATSLDVASSLATLGEVLGYRGNSQDAETVFRRLLELRRRLLNDNDLQITETCSRLARLLAARGEFAESAPLFREAITQTIDALGANHPDVARVNNDLAESLFAAGKLDQARRLLERSLRILDKAVRPNDATASRTRNNLAAVYAAEGRFPEAEELYRQDLQGKRSARTPNPLSAAVTLNNLGEVLQSQGRLEESAKCLEEAYRIRRESLPEDHPQRAQSACNLGYSLLLQGRVDEARPLLEDALETRRRTLPETHPQRISSLLGLAQLQFRCGEFESAGSLLDQAASAAERSLGTEHPLTGHIWARQGRCCLARNRIARGELLLLKSKTLLEKTVGSGHRYFGEVLHGLGEIKQREGKFPEAFPLLERSLAIIKDAAPWQRFEQAEILLLLGENLLQRNLPGPARERLEEALSHVASLRLEEHPLADELRLRLSRALCGEGEYAVAESVLAPLTDSQGRTQGRPAGWWFEWAATLADSLAGQRRHDEARKLLERVEQVCGDRPELRKSKLATMSRLAAIAFVTDAWEDAECWIRGCIEVSTDLFGGHSVETVRHQENLADLLELRRGGKVGRTIAESPAGSLPKQLSDPGFSIARQQHGAGRRALKGVGDGIPVGDDRQRNLDDPVVHVLDDIM